MPQIQNSRFPGLLSIEKAPEAEAPGPLARVFLQDLSEYAPAKHKIEAQRSGFNFERRSKGAGG